MRPPFALGRRHLQLLVVGLLALAVCVTLVTRRLSSQRRRQAPCLSRAVNGMCSFVAMGKGSDASAAYQMCSESPSEALHASVPLVGMVFGDAPAGLGQHHDQLRARAAAMRLKNRGEVKIFLGEGGRGRDVKYPDWISTDRHQMDAFSLSHWASLHQVSGGLAALFAEHVLEHFTPVQVYFVAAMAFLTLKPGGRFRIAVPDAYQPDPKYIQYVRVVWSKDSLPQIFEMVGFQVRLHEYFDLKGRFHRNEVTSPCALQTALLAQ